MRKIKTESDLQKWFTGELKKAGCVVYKFSSPAQRGVPDLIIIPQGQPTRYAEMKSPSGKGHVTGLQLRHMASIQGQGAKVNICATVAECEAVLADIKDV